ncbi:hypothetical protein LTR08_009188 [Meristemomyces frigidus]|nr:hypothetical protein LTR08_009188 [Meristemomyces frigidus]
MADAEAHGEGYEERNVHVVYEQIASHFSSTRYKPWPIIERFLKDLPNGSVGLDVGCGNGKYLAINPSIYIVGSDRSTNLTGIASLADILDLPHPLHAFDFAISIAVVHHLSTPERRVQAIKSMLDTLKPDGKALIYVWALEQESSRRGWTEQDDQDVMVPWVMRGSKKDRTTKGESGEDRDQNGDRTFHRYYHLYRKGELEHDMKAAGGHVLQAGYEKDNWWAVAGLSPQ